MVTVHIAQYIDCRTSFQLVLLLLLASSSHRTAKATKTFAVPGSEFDSSTKGDVIRWSQDGDLLGQIGDISRQETGERRLKKVELESAA